MKNLPRSAKTLNRILNFCFLIVLAQGIFTVGFHAAALYTTFTDPAVLTEKMSLSVDWLIIHADHGFGIGLDAAVKMKLIQLLSAAAYSAVGCCAIRVLKNILLPIELGQPFRKGISVDLHALGKHAFRLGLIENLSSLATVILIENHYGLPSLLTNDTITRISISWDSKLAWFIIAIMLSLLAMVFRHGEQLQTLSDETL